MTDEKPMVYFILLTINLTIDTDTNGKKALYMNIYEGPKVYPYSTL